MVFNSSLQANFPRRRSQLAVLSCFRAGDQISAWIEAIVRLGRRFTHVEGKEKRVQPLTASKVPKRSSGNQDSISLIAESPIVRVRNLLFWEKGELGTQRIAPGGGFGQWSLVGVQGKKEGVGLSPIAATELVLSLGWARKGGGALFRVVRENPSSFGWWCGCCCS